jgi:parallel beta-helix repeat protein
VGWDRLKRTLAIFLFLVCLVSFAATSNELCYNSACISDSQAVGKLSINFVHHSPIEISSDSDFVSYGFNGSGTIENPYQIEGYIIEDARPYNEHASAIWVRYTGAYFIIRNCLITTNYIGIRVNNVASGTVQVINNTVISTSNDGGGIGFGSLSNGSIINNTMINFNQGVHLNEVDFCLIEDNTIPNSNYQGINIRYSDYNEVRYNLIQNCTQHGLAIVGFSSTGNFIHHNTLQNNAQDEVYRIDGERTGPIHSQAYDEGVENIWFDATNQYGNWWSDYSGIGGYVIDGPSGSIDIFPQPSGSTLAQLINLGQLAGGVVVVSLIVIAIYFYWRKKR